jgi:ABC-2 type transport system ATP-binding protein
MNTQPVVEIRNLSKAYGTFKAVDDVSLEVTQGEIFGILGPNGAGKTTTVECVLGLKAPDAGQIHIMGLEPGQDAEELHLVVGAQLQESAMPAKLRVGEILDLYQSFYTDPADVTGLVEALGLTAKNKSYYRSLSGGQRQRLAVALALIGRPKVAILDEMSTGLDPQARREAWELIEQTRQQGTTIILVTHFMEEAERLCDRVALFDAGRIVAIGSPASIAARAAGGQTVHFTVDAGASFHDYILTNLPEVRSVARGGSSVTVTGTGSGELVNAVILALAAAGITPRDVHIDTQNLEDAFVKLTGHHHDTSTSAGNDSAGNDSAGNESKEGEAA